MLGVSINELSFFPVFVCVCVLVYKFNSTNPNYKSMSIYMYVCIMEELLNEIPKVDGFQFNLFVWFSLHLLSSWTSEPVSLAKHAKKVE
jgi:hypothetical protein